MPEQYGLAWLIKALARCESAEERRIVAHWLRREREALPPKGGAL